jgi:hypothetical protein
MCVDFFFLLSFQISLSDGRGSVIKARVGAIMTRRRRRKLGVKFDTLP